MFTHLLPKIEMKRSLSLLICLIFQIASAQKQGNKWYFGNRQALDFNNGNPVNINGCQIVPLPQAIGWFLSNEGTASIADGNGNLLFYSEGEHVWNSNNQLMPNGSGLMGSYSSTTSSFIIPVPLSNTLFYLFTTDGLEHGLQNGLRYTMIDMCLDSGRGDVIISQKNILVLDLVAEKLTAVNHYNHKDIWLITHKHFSDSFYAFLISEQGIIDTVISNIGSVYGPTEWESIGQMKSSPDGKRIVAVSGNGTDLCELFDFNDSTGIISNFFSLASQNHAYGVEFSPDNSKLFTFGLGGFVQFDLSGGSQSSINASRLVLNPGGCGICGMQLGPNGKIYVATGSYLPFPNLYGSSCQLLPANPLINCEVSFPSFIASYEYHNLAPDCPKIDTLIFPNVFTPNNDGLNDVFLPIRNVGMKLNEISIYNRWGELISHQNDPLILWDGKVNNKYSSDGIYYWILFFQNSKGINSSITGYIELMRQN